MRTFLTILGVSVGIGTVLFLVSLGYGLQRVILNQITNTDALLSLDVSSGTTGLISLNKENILKIRQIPGVVEVSPVISLSAQFSSEDMASEALVFAVNPSFFRLSGLSPRYGKVFNSADSYEIIISSAAAQLFGDNTDKIIGKKVNLTLFIPKINEEGLEEVEIIKREKPYLINGVIDDENTSFVYLPINTIDDLEINNYAEIKVKVSKNELMAPIREEIIGQGFLVSSLSDTIDQANKIFRVIQIILALFGLVALIVSAIGMFNTMTIALLERINEIGIMRSIGSSRGDIKLLFIFESSIMGFLGGLGGVTVGYLAGEIANLVLNFLARNLGGQALDLFYRPAWFVGIIIFLSTFIGFLTGIYPSIKASRLNPLEALRYK